MKNISYQKDIDAAIVKMNAFIKQKKMKHTPEREMILTKILALNNPFDVRTLYELINNDINVCLTTVYNTLKLLLECNLIIVHNVKGSAIMYQKMPDSANNYYKVCTVCNSIKNFTDLKLKKSITLRSSDSFTIKNQIIYLYGICKKCKNKEDKKRKYKTIVETN